MHEGHEGTERIPEADEQLGRAVVDAALSVHRALGPGLEPVYEACLAETLRRRGLASERQVGVRSTPLRRSHTAQVLSYLRFSGLRASAT